MTSGRMAVAQEGDFFLPALDQCLERQKQAVSWKSIYIALRDQRPASTRSAIERILKDETIRRYLTDPFSAFAAPSTQSRGQFETRTAAINSPTSGSQDGAFRQVKEDAAWLSQEAKIDEVYALRIAVLEYQSRASRQLLSAWSAEEIAALQQSVAPSSKYAVADLVKDQTGHTAENTQDAGARRKALLYILYEEREYLFKASSTIAALAQRRDLQFPDTQPLEHGPFPILDIRLAAGPIWKSQCELDHGDESSGVFIRSIDAIKKLLEHGMDAAQWPEITREDGAMGFRFTAVLFEQILSSLQLVQLHLSHKSVETSSSSDVRAWYDFVDDTSFLTGLAVINGNLEDIISRIHNLAALISVDILRISPTIEHIRSKSSSQSISLYPKLPKQSYVENEDCLKNVTVCLAAAAANGIVHASPAMLAWSLITQNLRILAQSETAQSNEDGNLGSSPPTSRRSSLRDSNIRSSRFEILLNAVLDAVPGDDAIAVLGSTAVDQMDVLNYIQSVIGSLSGPLQYPFDGPYLIRSRMTAFDLVCNCPPFLKFSPELVAALLTAFSYDDVNDISSSGEQPILVWPVQPGKSLREDESLLQAEFMPKVVSRYPFELNSFLLCLRAVARSKAYMESDGSAISRLLENLTSFTTVLPPEFEAYEVVPDNEADMSIRLLEPLPIFHQLRTRMTMSSRTSKSLSLHKQGDQYAIPAGTIGQVLRDQRPLIISFQYSHSGLEYIGALLMSLSPNATIADARYGDTFDVGAAADVLSLVNALLLGALQGKDSEAPKGLLDALNTGLPKNEDIVRVIFDIFEDQLQVHMSQPGTEDSISLLVQIVEFLELLLRITPDRVWSFLVRSRLLPMDESAGAIPAIVGATESPAGHYRFLTACTSLCGSLVTDCIRRAAANGPAASTRAMTRFDDQPMASTRASAKGQSTILFNFTRVIIDVLQSQQSWRFEETSERFGLMESMLKVMSTTLLHCYGTAVSATKGRLLAAFEPAAACIVSTFLSDHTPELPLQALTDILVIGLSALSSAESSAHPSLISVTTEAVSFFTVLLRTGTLQQRNGAALIKHLYQAISLLSRLYVAHEALKPGVAELLTVLAQYSGSTSKDPPSLLGHLPADPTKSFLTVIDEIESPTLSLNAEAAVWDMLSAIVSNKQQWLAVSLLTGSTPRERLRNNCKSQEGKRATIVKLALDRLSQLDSMAPRRAIAMLAFLSHAQDHWNWVSSTIGDHPNFVQSSTAWLAGLSLESRTTDLDAALRNANQTQTAALLANVLATFIHNTRESGQDGHIKRIMGNVAYLRDHAVAVDGYNHSLHKNLAKNFEQRYPGCLLDSFRRGSLQPAELGRNYYYDIDLADKVLSHDSSWRRSNGQGFVDELARANVNFSLVDSQIALLKSWKNLALELSHQDLKDPSMQQNMLTVVSACLQANIDSSMPTALFENVNEIRADFAFALLQRLVRAETASAELKSLFSLTWDTIRISGLDFEVIENARDAAYYRSLLQILFLALQPHVVKGTEAKSAKASLTKSADTAPTPVTPLTMTILEVTTKVIATNFRALCTSVHASTPSSPTIAQPSDFVLLTATLQSLLRIPVSDPVSRQLASTIATTNLIRYATSLYSWSDTLTPSDPVYAELSILFLLTLSTLPPVAEQMAVEGVLTSLSTANITQHLRGPGPATTAPLVRRGGRGPFDSPPRLHAVWARGILPLCLNILSAVGPGIVGEIAAFLNGFAAQIKRCEVDISSPLSPSPAEPWRGCISLRLAAEVHSLALLSVVVERLRGGAAAVGLNALEVEPLVFDGKGIAEVLRELLRNRGVLAQRVVPVGEREEGLARRKVGQDSVLVGLVEGELRGALECLSGV